MKVCYGCKIAKPVDAFNRRTNTFDGLQPRCRDCQSLAYQANAIKHKQNARVNRKKGIALAREFVYNYLLTHPCVDCNESDPIVLEFDHQDPTIKIAAISHMIGVPYGLTKIQAEIDKCDVRCANCHRRRTAKQFGHYRTVGRDQRGSPTDMEIQSSTYNPAADRKETGGSHDSSSN